MLTNCTVKSNNGKLLRNQQEDTEMSINAVDPLMALLSATTAMGVDNPRCGGSPRPATLLRSTTHSGASDPSIDSGPPSLKKWESPNTSPQIGVLSRKRLSEFIVDARSHVLKESTSTFMPSGLTIKGLSVAGNVDIIGYAACKADVDMHMVSLDSLFSPNVWKTARNVSSVFERAMAGDAILVMGNMDKFSEQNGYFTYTTIMRMGVLENYVMVLAATNSLRPFQSPLWNNLHRHLKDRIFM